MPNIGAASQPSNEATLIVLASPVWDYFAGGMKPLRIYVEDQKHRTAEHLGMVKTGGNYAAAMGPTLAAKEKYKIDQVLFCPGGSVQETGAANFLLIREGHILTRSLDSTFLHGVTRDSLLTMARDMGFKVEERVFDVAEMLEWVKTGEAALSGTAAVLAGVGTLVHRGSEHRVGTGEVGPVTQTLARGARRHPERRSARPLRLDAQGLRSLPAHQRARRGVTMALPRQDATDHGPRRSRAPIAARSPDARSVPCEGRPDDGFVPQHAIAAGTSARTRSARPPRLRSIAFRRRVPAQAGDHSASCSASAAA